MLINVIGFLASTISFIMFVPQARTVWVKRNNPLELEGVSRAGQWLLLCNATFWGVYAVMTGAYWSGAPGLLNAPLAIIVLVMLAKASKVLQEDARCTSCSYEGEHMIFVTSPPGYGSLVECGAETSKSGTPVPVNLGSPDLPQRLEGATVVP